MTSEIRANIIKNRVGLGTIEYSNTGPIISGVTTALNFKTGTSNLHNTGLSVQDLDVDGHTNLDNVSIAGVSTFSGVLDATNTPASIRVAQDIQHKGDADTKINFHEADKLRIELGGVTPAFSGLKSTSGAPHAKWGINVATPAAALHIDEAYNHQGVLRVTNGNQNSNYYHQLEMSGTNNIFTLWKHYDGTNNYNSHAHGSTGHIWYISGSEKLRLHSNGNVGIGTNNPQCILDINKDIAGGVNYVDIRNHHATGGAALRVKTQGSYGSPFYQGILGASDAGGTIRVGAVSNHPLAFIINNQEKVRIDTTGRVQVGSTNATSKNQFNGPGLLNLQNNNADGTVDYTQGIVFTNNNSNEGTWTQAAIVTTGSTGYNGNLIFATDGSGARDNSVSNFTERLRITSAGLVQIDTPGVTAGNGASAKLQVDSTSQYNGLLLGNAATYGTISRGANNGALVYTANAYPANLGGGEKITHEWWSGSAGGGGPSQIMALSASGRLQIGSSTSSGYNQFNGPGRLNINNNSADGTVDFSQGIVFTDNTNNGGTWTHGGIVCTGSTGYNGNLIFGTDGSGAQDNSASNITERMRINSNGKLMLGTTSDVSNVIAIFGKNHNNTTAISVENTDTNSSARIRYEFKNGSSTSYIEKYNSGGWYMFNGTPSSSNPNLGLYSSSSWMALRLRPGDVSNDVAEFYQRWGTSNGILMNIGSAQSGTAKAIRFLTSHYGGERGYIGVTLGGTSYNSSSDYRMKQDVVDLTGAIDRVKSFKPRRFKWKEDPTYTVDGFLAHEASTVVPESVDGEKDAVDSKGDPKYQVMDNSKLVPVLTAALKEAIAKIEILEAKVAALEG